MLEEASEEAAHPDVLALPGHARRQATDAPHDEVDLHAGVRGLLQGADDLRIDEAVDLREDPGGAPGAGGGRLGFDQGDDPAGEVEGGDQQMLEPRGSQVAGEHVEEQPDVRGNLLIGGQQREVRVDAGGLGVVVPGPEVGVAAQHAVLLAGDEAGLAVRLEPVQPVDDVGAGLLQLPAPGRGAGCAGRQRFRRKNGARKSRGPRRPRARM